MSQLLTEHGWHTLTYNCGAFITLQFKVEATALTTAYPAVVSITAAHDHMTIPLPSSAVARKMAELFNALADDMDKEDS